MNTELILRIADAIERHEIPDLGFNMKAATRQQGQGEKDYSGHNCGTAACVYGWYLEVCKLDGIEDTGMAEVLGVDDHEVIGPLIMPKDYARYPENYPAEKAIRTLRHLAATGSVDWTV